MARVTLPGLIDVHVHFRDPGAVYKEDFYTGSRSAVAGGFTFVIDMPNNPTPTVSIEALEEKIALADKKAVCDIGFHYGTNGKNVASFKAAMAHPRVFGLKLYCNHTTGEMLIEDIHLLEEVFAAWESDKPILVHAEGVQLAAVLTLAHFYKRRLHVCHISQAVEVELVRRAKERKWLVTAGVCPHHLFLVEGDSKKLGSFALMKPPLGTKQDREALRKGLSGGVIDVIETDHAPHTLAEKQSTTPPFGVPGLETALGLTYKAVEEGWLKEAAIKQVLYDKPREIFAISEQKDTYIEVDTVQTTVVGQEGYATKCGWSPFEGWELPVKVMKVVIGGKNVLEDKIV